MCLLLLSTTTCTITDEGVGYLTTFFFSDSVHLSFFVSILCANTVDLCFASDCVDDAFSARRWIFVPPLPPVVIIIGNHQTPTAVVLGPSYSMSLHLRLVLDHIHDPPTERKRIRLTALLFFFESSCSLSNSCPPSLPEWSVSTRPDQGGARCLKSPSRQRLHQDPKIEYIPQRRSGFLGSDDRCTE